MKILLVFAAVVATNYAANYTQEVLTNDYTATVFKQLRKCKEQFPSISEEDFKKLSSCQKMPSTKDEECFALCFAKKRGYYNRPGKMNLKKLKTANSQKYKQPTNLAGANKIDEICVKKVQKETNDCKTAAKFFICRSEQAKSINFKFAKPTSK